MESHRLELIAGAKSLYDTLFGDLARARRRIYIECYIVSSDRMGRELYEALDAACKRGVQVQLLYDPLGSEHTDSRFFDDLRAAGVQVRPYGSMRAVHGAGLLGPRDHGRVVVIDDAAYTGGAAWGEQWLPKDRGGRGWHDVCCRVEGPVVDDFVRLFGQRFAEGAGERKIDDFDTRDRYPDLRLVSDTPNEKESWVYAEHEAAFRRAERRIWITNAYFYPPPPMIEAMGHAVSRGVDVRLLLPAESDLPILKRAARSEYRDWLADGFQIWEYEATVLHAKYAIVDDDWCSVGTFNANPTSVGMANEVNLFIRDPAFVARMARQFQEDQSHAARVTEKDVSSRPVARKVADALAGTVLDLAALVWGPR